MAEEDDVYSDIEEEVADDISFKVPQAAPTPPTPAPLPTKAASGPVKITPGGSEDVSFTDDSGDLSILSEKSGGPQPKQEAPSKQTAAEDQSRTTHPPNLGSSADSGKPAAFTTPLPSSPSPNATPTSGQTSPSALNSSYENDSPDTSGLISHDDQSGHNTPRDATAQSPQTSGLVSSGHSTPRAATGQQSPDTSGLVSHDDVSGHSTPRDAEAGQSPQTSGLLSQSSGISTIADPKGPSPDTSGVISPGKGPSPEPSTLVSQHSNAASQPSNAVSQHSSGKSTPVGNSNMVSQHSSGRSTPVAPKGPSPEASDVYSQDDQPKQQPQQQPDQNQKEGVSLNVGMEPPQSKQLPPGLRPEKEASEVAAEEQAALKKQQEARAQAEKELAQGGLSSKCEETGVDIPSCLQLFMIYDKDGNCSVGLEEFGQMLFDLDGMADVNEKVRDLYIRDEFESADLNHDGVISIDEFYFYFYRELCFKFPILRSGVNPGADLFNIFVKYASFGSADRSEEMTSNQFSKLCRECKLYNNKTVVKADIDIIFSRCRAETEVLEAHKPKAGSAYTTARMMYPQFLFGLLKIAEKRKSGFQEVVGKIIENCSAVPRASMADLLVFRNRGVEKDAEEWVERPRGLPKLPRVANDSSERMAREAALAKSLKLPGAKKGKAGAGAGAAQDDDDDDDLNITEALVSTQTKKQWGLQGFGSAESLGLPCVGRKALNDPSALIAIRKLSPDHLMMALKRTFEKFNVWQHGTNKGAMDKIRFKKMMRDAQFIRECGSLSSTTADHIFQRSLPVVEDTLNFVQFLTSLRHVAAALRISLNEVMEAIVLINAPLE